MKDNILDSSVKGVSFTALANFVDSVLSQSFNTIYGLLRNFTYTDTVI